MSLCVCSFYCVLSSTRPKTTCLVVLIQLQRYGEKLIIRASLATIDRVLNNLSRPHHLGFLRASLGLPLVIKFAAISNAQNRFIQLISHRLTPATQVETDGGKRGKATPRGTVLEHCFEVLKKKKKKFRIFVLSFLWVFSRFVCCRWTILHSEDSVLPSSPRSKQETSRTAVRWKGPRKVRIGTGPCANRACSEANFLISGAHERTWHLRDGPCRGLWFFWSPFLQLCTQNLEASTTLLPCECLKSMLCLFARMLVFLSAAGRAAFSSHAKWCHGCWSQVNSQAKAMRLYKARLQFSNSCNLGPPMQDRDIIEVAKTCAAYCGLLRPHIWQNGLYTHTQD